MICFRDMAFCNSDCTNEGCVRFVSSDVNQLAEEYGLPVALEDLSFDCLGYEGVGNEGH